MSGNAWIIIGVIAVALAAFAIPYGFYKKSSQNASRNATKSESIVTLIAQEFGRQLSDKYPQGHTVFGITRDGFVVPKGLIPSNLKVFWDTGKVHNISNDVVRITLPEMVLGGMRISRNVTDLVRQVGAKSGPLISIGGISPRVEIIGIQGDLVVVALGFEAKKQSQQ